MFDQTSIRTITSQSESQLQTVGSESNKRTLFPSIADQVSTKREEAESEPSILEELDIDV